MGREEYLVEDHPLCTFSSVLDDLVAHGQAYLVLRHKDNISLEVCLLCRFLTTAQVASDVVYPQMEKIARHNVPAGGLKRSQSAAGKLYKRNMEPTSSKDMEGLAQSH